MNIIIGGVNPTVADITYDPNTNFYHSRTWIVICQIIRTDTILIYLMMVMHLESRKWTLVL